MRPRAALRADHPVPVATSRIRPPHARFGQPIAARMFSPAAAAISIVATDNWKRAEMTLLETFRISVSKSLGRMREGVRDGKAYFIIGFGTSQLARRDAPTSLHRNRGVARITNSNFGELCRAPITQPEIDAFGLKCESGEQRLPRGGVVKQKAAAIDIA